MLPGLVGHGGGRFLHARDDLDELLADATRIAADDLLTLRLREWPGG